MLQRGRKSAANLAALGLNGSPPRLTAPAGLLSEECALFDSVTSSLDPKHLRESDLPMLVAYVQASLLSRRLARTDKVAEWEKATRLMATLATKLRLTPQSRVDPKALARQEPSLLRKPWEPREPWEDDG